MEKFAGLIQILLEHSQRFYDIWNFQIVVSLAVLGFVLSNQELVARYRIRTHITLVFLLIALFSLFTLSVHHQREVLLWNALKAHVTSAPTDFTLEEVAYLDSLRPTSFLIKGGALLFADLLVIAVTWMVPKVRQQ